jgi:hypothetical protein
MHFSGVGLVFYGSAGAKRRSKIAPTGAKHYFGPRIATNEPLLMKKSLLLVVSLVAVVAVMSGCNTVSKQDSSVGHLPKNTIVIRNRTAYTLMVLRDGIEWRRAEVKDGRTYQLPVEVMPRQEIVLYNVASHPRERITFGLLATGPWSCLGPATIRKYRFRLHLGTDNPPVLVTIRSTGF